VAEICPTAISLPPMRWSIPLVLVLVLALMATSCGDDDASPSSAVATTTASTATTGPPATDATKTTPASSSTIAVTTSSTTTPVTTLPATTDDPFTEIVVSIAGGAIDGGGRIEVETGSQVRLVVTSDVADEIHVHGYDVFGDLEPGVAAVIEFTADIPGIFEVELEGSHLEILELQVS